MTWLLCMIGAYLVGSIPFGLLIGLSRGVDIRTRGSGNVGATNLGRELGRSFGILCFVLDAGKGAVSVLVSGWLNGTLGTAVTAIPAIDAWAWLGVAGAALLGHVFSPWLRFRGGKGVATGFGGLAAMWPLLTIPALVAIVAWVAVVRVTRYVSVASVVAAATLPLTCVVLAVVRAMDAEELSEPMGASVPPIVMTAALALMVAWKHRGNLARVRRGEEPRVGNSST